MNHILRYYIPEDKAEERIPEIIDYCKKTGCQQVVLFTSSYDRQPSFIPLSEIERYSEKLCSWTEVLRREGIKVGINVLATLGHIYFPEELSSQFPFQRRVDIDGNISLASACPLDSTLQQYLISAYKLYARVKPNLVFIDDDYRYITESIFCFCSLHLEEFHRRSGKKIDLSELKSHIVNNSLNPDPIKYQYSEMLNDSLIELAAKLRDAVHEISPESCLGFMTCEPPACLWGLDLERLAEVLAEGNQGKPFLRPQICVYYEDTFKTVPLHFASPMITRNLCAGKVEMYPEIENYMYTTFAKSAQFTRSQIITCLLNGMDNLMLNIFDMFGSPLAENRDIIEMLERNKDYFRRLKEMVPTGTLSEGIAMPVHKKSPIYRRVDTTEKDWYGTKKGWLELFSGLQTWYNWIPMLGLPIGYHWETSPWNFLFGDDILGMTEEEIEGFLKRGVLVDGRALECLEYRGYGKRVGFTVAGKLSLDEIGYECFRDFEFHHQLAGRCHPLHATASENDYRRITPLFPERVQVLSEIINYAGKSVSPMIAIFENERGERIGVLAYCGGMDARISIVNSRRQIQFRRLFAWLGREELPVAVINRPYLAPTYQKVNGRILLGLFNLSSDVVSEVALQLPEVEKGRFRTGFLDGNGAIKKFKVIKPQKEEPVYIFIHKILPYEIKVFLFEEKSH